MEKNLEEYNDKGRCPYCGCQYFLMEVISLENNEFVNTCYSCNEKSISSNDIQYKIIE